MADIGIRILAGICGAALFAVINQYVLTLSGATWLAAMAAMFVLAFVAALIVQWTLQNNAPRRGQQTIASKNKSRGAMKVRVDGIPDVKTETSTIGSENESGGDMSLTVKTETQK